MLNHEPPGSAVQAMQRGVSTPKTFCWLKTDIQIHTHSKAYSTDYKMKLNQKLKQILTDFHTVG